MLQEKEKENLELKSMIDSVESNTLDSDKLDQLCKRIEEKTRRMEFTYDLPSFKTVCVDTGCMPEYDRMALLLGPITNTTKFKSKEKRLVASYVLHLSNGSERRLNALPEGLGQISQMTKKEQNLYNQMGVWKSTATQGREQGRIAKEYASNVDLYLKKKFYPDGKFDGNLREIRPVYGQH